MIDKTSLNLSTDSLTRKSWRLQQQQIYTKKDFKQKKVSTKRVSGTRVVVSNSSKEKL